MSNDIKVKEFPTPVRGPLKDEHGVKAPAFAVLIETAGRQMSYLHKLTGYDQILVRGSVLYFSRCSCGRVSPRGHGDKQAAAESTNLHATVANARVARRAAAARGWLAAGVQIEERW